MLALLAFAFVVALVGTANAGPKPGKGRRDKPQTDRRQSEGRRPDTHQPDLATQLADLVDMQQRQIDVLSQLISQVPAAARPALQQALDNARQGQATALRIQDELPGARGKEFGPQQGKAVQAPGYAATEEEANHPYPRRRLKGNNGVGNGLDPQPPGNPPINDGFGTRPGNPGARFRIRR